MSETIKIVLADDHPIVRQGLRQLIEKDEKLAIVAEAENGEEALRLIAAHVPDVAVLDIDMPQMDGFAVARRLRRENSRVEIVFLTMHSENEVFQKALDLGAKGYVLKDSAVADIVNSIKSVAAGRPYISSSLSGLLFDRLNQSGKSERTGLDLLSPTERRILRMIADEKTSREIADELFISHRTVETHRANIARKLELHGSLALVKYAVLNRKEL
ncbi:MAG: response regulator transcription factor [Acidobacteria bacterium]|nr:response regulator transcription factor [Acidobacteriota bacterium]